MFAVLSRALPLESWSPHALRPNGNSAIIIALKRFGQPEFLDGVGRHQTGRLGEIAR